MEIGGWAFIVGLVVAIIVAIVSAAAPPSWAVFLLAALGLVAGFLNVTDKEVNTFLIAGLSFLVSFQALSSIFTTITLGWAAISAFFDLLSIFIAPAIAIVAVKALYQLTKD